MEGLIGVPQRLPLGAFVETHGPDFTRWPDVRKSSAPFA
jgi:hypothetical protein